MESTVEWFFNEMEMTFDWKRRWGRWEVLGFCSYLVDELESNKENSEG